MSTLKEIRKRHENSNPDDWNISDGMQAILDRGELLKMVEREKNNYDNLLACQLTKLSAAEATIERLNKSLDTLAKYEKKAARTVLEQQETIIDLKLAINEALEWNWLDDDAPDSVRQEIRKLIDI